MRSKSTLLAVIVLGFAATVLNAQADPTAIRPGGLQVGVTYSNVHTDEFKQRIAGVSAYATWDFTPNLGVEADFRFPTLQTPNNFAERSYLAGLRYVRHYGRFQPFVRATGGIGQTLTTKQVAILPPGTPGTYGAIAGGVGLDYRLTYRIRLRAEYEQQFWPGFPPNGLSPSIVSAGVAYHFRIK